jgi:uracil-DNA glycosylase
MFELLEKSWKTVLGSELQKPYIKKLEEFLEREKGEFFPPKEEVFEAFKKTPFDKVKVVIVGQDPYHGEGQAHGLCFSVKKGISLPPSLKNIYKELQQDLGIVPEKHGFLSKWADEGVLLLNTTLTVRKKEPLSHFGKGWEEFTDAVIEKLCKREDPLVFILWGKLASEKCKRVLHAKHCVLIAAHPSPFSAKNFFGCKHFSKTNAFLESVQKKQIDWRV